MARLIQQPKEEHLAYLRQLMHYKFSRSITNTHDCETLKEEIFKETRQSISADTLRRLFKIIKTETLPSGFTLNVCSEFVGFESWEHLVKNYSGQDSLYQKSLLQDVVMDSLSFDGLKGRVASLSRSAVLHETFNQIILVKWQGQDEHFFSRIFEITPIFEINESHKYNIYHTIHLLGVLCHKTAWLANIAIQHWHSLPFAHDYFVEWLVVPQYGYYAPLLENYLKAKKDVPQANIFYNLIHATQHAGAGNWELFLLHYKELYDCTKNAPLLNNTLTMRLLGLQMYYEKYCNDGLRLQEVLDAIFSSAEINAKDAGNRISSIFIISHYLFFTGEYATVGRLFEQKCNADILGFWAEMNFNQLKVYYAFSLLRLGRRAEAKVIYGQVEPEKFDLNFRAVIEPLYGQLEKELSPPALKKQEEAG